MHVGGCIVKFVIRTQLKTITCKAAYVCIANLALHLLDSILVALGGDLLFTLLAHLFCVGENLE